MWWFKKKKETPERTYLDHAASSPLNPLVWEAMEPWVRHQYGNPSAIHAEGRAARGAIENARALLARLLSVRPDGVVFTASGTTANNLAVIGYCARLVSCGRAWSDLEIITTPIEHPSVREACAELARRGAVVHTLPVTAEGILLPETLKTALTPKTALVTLAYVNSEVGTVQSLHALSRVVRQYERNQTGVRIMMHADAAQAPLWLPCDLPRLGADMLTLDSAKCGGPKGTGALVMLKGVEVEPIVWGGGQEGGRWSGTENVAGIVGMAAALQIAQAGYKVRAEAVGKVRDAAVMLLETELPGSVLNGPALGDKRVANNLNLSLPGYDTEYAVVVLDTAGIAASTKSACAGAGGGESVVVMTLANDPARARSTIRFTLGEETTVADFEKVVVVLKKFIARQSN